MTIPDEAVEAAYGQVLADDSLRYVTKTTLRNILELAAPHILAPLVADLDKWAGRNKPGYYDEAQDDVAQVLKPYRSQAWQ